MSNAGALEGLSGSLLSIASDPEQVARLHRLLDRYCHRFRNRMNSMKLSLYLGRKSQSGGLPERWSDLEARYQALERFVDRLQQFCRPMEINPIDASLEAFLKERRAPWESILSSRGIGLQLTAPARQTPARFDPLRLASGLDAMISWRGESLVSGGLVVLSWGHCDGWVHLRWEERGRSSTVGQGVSGSMALPLLARILGAHGGELRVETIDPMAFEIRWPEGCRPC